MTHRRRAHLVRAIVLLLLLVLASWLRLRGIGDDSLWGDESLTAILAGGPLTKLIPDVITTEQIPPLHHMIVHFWIRIFGDTDASMRMPSAIAGVAAVWVMYLFIARLFGRRTGLIAALLLAVSPMDIAYSQEARAYGLFLLTALCSCDAFVRLLQRPTPRRHTWYVIASTLMLYTHVYGLFTLLAQVLVLAWKWWRGRERDMAPVRPWVRDWVAIAALFSPWIPIVIKWTRMINVSFWVKTVTFDDISRAYWTYAGSTVVYLALIGLTVIGVYRFRRRRMGVALLLALLLVPVVLPVTISVLNRPAFSPRYGIVAMTGMIGLSAAGIAALRPRALGVVVLLVIAWLSPQGDAPAIPRAHWREIGQFLDQNVRPNDLVVIHLRHGTRSFDRYVHRKDIRRTGIDTAALPVQYSYEPRRVWFVAFDALPGFTLNNVIKRAPVRIGKRMFTPLIIAVELIEDPEPLFPQGPAATTTSAPSTATTRRSPTP